MKTLPRARNIFCACRSAEKNCEYLCDRWTTQLPTRVYAYPHWPLMQSDLKNGKLEDDDS